MVSLLVSSVIICCFSNVNGSPLLVLDGSSSMDPDQDPGPLLFSWACNLEASGAPCFDSSLTLILATPTVSATSSLNTTLLVSGFKVSVIRFSNVFSFHLVPSISSNFRCPRVCVRRYRRISCVSRPWLPCSLWSSFASRCPRKAPAGRVSIPAI